ncbi:MAG: 50S ribosomal protein L11 methyltransferase [Desulfuromonas sp.]|uniref:50S ribosomal protein L11 methyltransferase n=1 Tax=Desulfuromonas thiophila TaxID=57664 RepID=UPI0024A8501D|nr:50S ribosomal protein L11 methyltransferase [Desulfuromonas thiophila]MDD3800763.1 50S ribosomal protein L11 methyltransferase [Desulfuromonas thiophila]
MGRLFTPFCVGNCFEIIPPHDQARQPQRTTLVMAEGAFGSGEHETTASCLEIIPELPLQNADILDLGCGTGILAIAALKRGARQALCVDIEPAAINSCRINAQLNQVESRISVLCGELHQLGAQLHPCDLIFANIYGDILLAVAETLVQYTKPGGLLLLSGILYEYNFDVRQCYQRLGCQLLKNRLLMEFSTLLLQRLPD